VTLAESTHRELGSGAEAAHKIVTPSLRDRPSQG
jgi:hypothetical protein